MLTVRPPETLLSNWGYTRAKRIADGVCTGCGGELIDAVRRTSSGVKKRMCELCLKKNAERTAKKRAIAIAKNLCRRCFKKSPRLNRSTCEECAIYCSDRQKERSKKTFFDRKARNGNNGKLYSTLAAKALWSLWKSQRGCCALTGIRLTRNNAEIDHILPRSKGGTNEKSNLRWLHEDVNQARQALSDDQFISLCRAVVAYAERVKK